MSEPKIISVNRAPRALIAQALLVLLTLAGAPDLPAQVVRPDFYVTNGPVRAAVLSGNTLFIGGQFSQVGPPTGGGVPIDSVTAAPVPGFPRVNGRVHAVASDGAGGWFIGGEFTAVGGISRSNLAHIDVDLTVSKWNPGASGIVRALVSDGVTVYVGGAFGFAGGLPRDNIAALDIATGLATAWNPDASGTVFDLVVHGASVYVGGGFASIGGQPRVGIAELSLATGLATGWNPDANSGVRALAVQGSTIYAGGQFDSIGGQARNHIAALDSTTGLATAWNPNADIQVNALAISGTTVYAGGFFTTIGGQTRNRIAALSVATGLATSWSPLAPNNGSVEALAVSGSTVYAGGNFSSMGGQPRIHLVALDAATALATAWDPNPASLVYSLAVSGGVVFAGGDFTSIGGQARRNLAALNATTGVVTAWNAGAMSGVFPGPLVEALAVDDSRVYVGGDFATIAGTTRNNIAALDIVTGALLSWNPNANDAVRALAYDGSTIYAGGDFTNIGGGGLTRNRIAALSRITGSATSWNPNANNFVSVLAVNGSTVYAGGQFNNIGGQARNGIAALSAVSGIATDWNPNASPTSRVAAILVSGSAVVVGGNFTSIGGESRSRLAMLDATSGLARSWNPGANAIVNALAWSGASTVYAGGQFTSTGGQQRNYLAALDVSSDAARPWNPDANDEVRTLVWAPGLIYAGGDFTAVGTEAGGVAAIEAACVPVGEVADSSTTFDSPEVTTTGDFDADGLLDVATVVAGGVEVMRNLGGGDFAHLSFETTTGIGRGIATAHLDHDFVLDLAVSTTNGLQVMLGEAAGGVPTGGFGPPVTYPVGVDPTGIGIGDFDEDGINDLAVAVSGANSVKVLLGQGTGGVSLGSYDTPVTHAVGTAPLGLVVSDFNNDGIWDLAATNSGSSTVSVLPGQGAAGIGNGGFAAAVGYAVGSSPHPLVAGDFNEDGIADLASGASAANQISVLIGSTAGNGTFNAAVTYGTDGPVRDLEVADFDGDGRVDLGAVLGAGGAIQHLYGDGSSTLGNGAFLISGAYYLGGYLSTLEFGAFDLLASKPSTVLARMDRDELLTLEGGCITGTTPTLELTSPNGGQVWQLGTNVSIRWTRGPLVQAVHIEVSRDDGVHWRRIASDQTGTEFSWTLTPPGASQGRLRIVDAHRLTLGDASNGSFSMQPLVGVDEVPARPSFSLAYPNPSREAASFVLSLPAEGMVSVEVFDLAGRRVHTLARGLRAPGEHSLTWDGRVSGGGRAAAGVYFVRALMPGFEAVRRLVRIE